ncbi:MAG: glycosyltransferase family 2 protein [Methanobacteriaceae archaeon]|nr:glycosyltransferase family 2 protein [Methanobacteriaceae archaeon]MDP2835969.1 glycosyltransferase family 2 protein [Methanobacteriaceae archaeon]
MSKTIFSISMVKNESDVIESFVRYNLNILDGMIILDNQSSDNTLEILNLLKKEGLNLYIIKDEDREFDQAIKTNKLLSCAIDKYNADIVVPLDADEFIMTHHSKNPREFLEKIEFPTLSLVKWKTYVPTFDKENEKFIPSKITFARGDYGDYCKAIIPKELVEKFDVKLTKGNHNISNSKNDKSIKRYLNNDLRIAHFPIRSEDQIIAKIAVGWINTLCDITRGESTSWHIKDMFNYLKHEGKIGKEDMINFAKKYALDDQAKEVKIEYDPLDLKLFNNISIKYEDYKINYISNILENSETLAKDYSNLKKKYLNLEKEQKRFRSEMDKYEANNDNLILKLNKLVHDKNQLELKINEYKNSTSWRLTSPMRKFIVFLKN